MIVWSDEILKVLENANPKETVIVYLGWNINRYFSITGIEDSLCIGWWEIRFTSGIGLYSITVTVETLLANLPSGEMVMLQEGGHSGKSYPITRVFRSRDGWIIACDNSDLEYWDELEKWKIEQDNIRIGITNFMRDELEKRK